MVTSKIYIKIHILHTKNEYMTKKTCWSGLCIRVGVQSKQIREPLNAFLRGLVGFLTQLRKKHTNQESP